jgi:propanol-preferring alcohol dehydrogenase
MKAMVLEKAGTPLVMMELPLPHPQPDQVLVKVTACGVCRTDPHLVDGDLEEPALPIVPGHEVVGEVVDAGRDVKRLKVGDKIGIPGLGATCGACRYCRAGKISATARASPGIRSMAATPNTRSPTPATPSRFPPAPMPRSRHGSAQV